MLVDEIVSSLGENLMTPEVTDTVVNEIEEFQDHEVMHHSHFAISNHQELCKPWQYKAYEENKNHFDDEF